MKMVDIRNRKLNQFLQNGLISQLSMPKLGQLHQVHMEAP